MKWYEIAIIGLIALGILSKKEVIPAPVTPPLVEIPEEEQLTPEEQTIPPLITQVQQDAPEEPIATPVTTTIAPKEEYWGVPYSEDMTKEEKTKFYINQHKRIKAYWALRGYYDKETAKQKVKRELSDDKIKKLSSAWSKQCMQTGLWSPLPEDVVREIIEQ